MKYYSISEVAQKTSLTAHTLRYYEKEGLIHIERKANGIRIFSENDMEILSIIACLKETGMSITAIKEYFALCHTSHTSKESLDIRKTLFLQQKEKLEHKIQSLQDHLATVKYKIWYYENIEVYGDEGKANNCQHMRELYEQSQKNTSLTPQK